MPQPPHWPRRAGPESEPKLEYQQIMLEAGRTARIIRQNSAAAGPGRRAAATTLSLRLPGPVSRSHSLVAWRAAVEPGLALNLTLTQTWRAEGKIQVMIGATISWLGEWQQVMYKCIILYNIVIINTIL